VPFAGLCVGFPERMSTACGTDSADRRNHSRWDLEWGVAEKRSDRADLTATGNLGRKRSLGSVPGRRFPISLIVVCHMSVEAALE